MARSVGVVVSLLMMGIAAPATAGELALESLGVTISVPDDEGWIVVDTWHIARPFGGDAVMVEYFYGFPCEDLISTRTERGEQVIASPAAIPATWHHQATAVTSSGGLVLTLCADIDGWGPLVAGLSSTSQDVEAVGAAATNALAALVEVLRGKRSPATPQPAPTPQPQPAPTPQPDPTDTSYDYGPDPYGSDGYGAPDPYAPPAEPVAPPRRGDRGGNPLVGASSTNQLDLRAGVSHLDPSTSVPEASTGFAVGANLPLRWVTSRFAVQARGHVAHAGPIGTVFDVHAGGAFGRRWDSFALAWTGGLGFDSWTALDPMLGAEAHVYTGPAVRIGNTRTAVDLELAIVLRAGGGGNETRMRADVATDRIRGHKLVVGVERTTSESARAITLMIGIGFGR